MPTFRPELGLRPTALAVCLLLVSCAVAHGAAERFSANGLAVYVQPAVPGDTNLVTLTAFVRAGRSVAAPAPRASADLLAGWLAHGGTQSLPGHEFAAARSALEVELTAAADESLIVLEMRCPRANLHPVARLFADLLMHPAFEPEIEARARSAAGSAPGRGDALVTDALRQLAPGFDPAAAHGERKAEPRASRSDAMDLHERRFGADATVVAVSGRLEGMSVEDEIRNAFLGYEPGATPLALSDPGGAGAVTITRRETAAGRSRVLVARKGTARSDPDALAVLGGLLAAAEGTASRLGRELGPSSVRGVVRVVESGSDADVVLLDLSLPTPLAEAAVMASGAALVEVARGRAGDDLVQRARARLQRLFVVNPEEPRAARSYALLEALGFPPRRPSESWAALSQFDGGALGRALSRSGRPALAQRGN